jgi:MYXO-CTERM domain-containing protein
MTDIVDLVTEIASFTPTSSCTNAFAPTCNNTSDVSWSGSLTLTYVYTPNNAVPEPGGLGVFAVGLLGLGLLKGLRRQG